MNRNEFFSVMLLVRSNRLYQLKALHSIWGINFSNFSLALWKTARESRKVFIKGLVWESRREWHLLGTSDKAQESASCQWNFLSLFRRCLWVYVDEKLSDSSSLCSNRIQMNWVMLSTSNKSKRFSQTVYNPPRMFRDTKNLRLTSILKLLFCENSSWIHWIPKLALAALKPIVDVIKTIKFIPCNFNQLLQSTVVVSFHPPAEHLSQQINILTESSSCSSDATGFDLYSWVRFWVCQVCAQNVINWGSLHF